MNSDEENHHTSDERVPVLKKERSSAKGAITRAITNIEKIPKTQENIDEIKKKLQGLPELIENFEEIHHNLIQHLTNGEDKEKAMAYRKNVLSEVEGYETAAHTWIAGEEADSEDAMQTTRLRSDSEVTTAADPEKSDEHLRLSKLQDEIQEAKWKSNCWKKRDNSW